VQRRGLEPQLAAVVVDVQQAALGSDAGAGLRLIDRRGDAVDMQDTRERQSTEAGTDDGDAGGSRRRA